jgi:hypothetical protein
MLGVSGTISGGSEKGVSSGGGDTGISAGDWGLTVSGVGISGFEAMTFSSSN